MSSGLGFIWALGSAAWLGLLTFARLITDTAWGERSGLNHAFFPFPSESVLLRGWRCEGGGGAGISPQAAKGVPWKGQQLLQAAQHHEHPKSWELTGVLWPEGAQEVQGVTAGPKVFAMMTPNCPNGDPGVSWSRQQCHSRALLWSTRRLCFISCSPGGVQLCRDLVLKCFFSHSH